MNTELLSNNALNYFHKWGYEILSIADYGHGRAKIEARYLDGNESTFYYDQDNGDLVREKDDEIVTVNGYNSYLPKRIEDLFVKTHQEIVEMRENSIDEVTIRVLNENNFNYRYNKRTKSLTQRISGLKFKEVEDGEFYEKGGGNYAKSVSN